MTLFIHIFSQQNLGKIMIMMMYLFIIIISKDSCKLPKCTRTLLPLLPDVWYACT